MFKIAEAQKLREKIISDLVTKKPKGKYLHSGYNNYVRGFGLDVMKYIWFLEERIEVLEMRLNEPKSSDS